MNPYYTDDAVTLWHGKCEDILPTLPDCSVDAVVTDPPYELGFMGKGWDSTGIAYSVDMWAECLRVLKPGGHLLSFGGTRTWHRMAVAVEDAGFEMRDSIAWIYGSGFPKSLDVSKAIDKRANVNDETHRRIALVAEVIRTHREAKCMERAAVSLAVVGTPSGACWNWEHQQLPSVEMWPAIKRVLDIPDKFDGLIDGTREMFIGAEREVIGERTTGIGTGRGSVAYIADSDNRDITAPATPDAARWEGWGTALKPAFEPIVVARKPLAGTVAANVLTWGTGALNVDACRVGDEVRHAAFTSLAPASGNRLGAEGTQEARRGTQGEPKEYVGRWPANVTLDPEAAAELDRQSGESASATGVRDPNGSMGYHGGASGLPGVMSGYADKGGASRFFPVFRYEAKAPTSERPKVNGKAHPTVKPLDLMRWLVRLVTPTGGTILDPFAGSGTTGEACVIEGFNAILIEMEEDHLPLITQRLSKPIAPVLDLGALA